MPRKDRKPSDPKRRHPKTAKNPMGKGRYRHEVTANSRAIVKMLVVAGQTQESIAPLIGVKDTATLRKYYRPELDHAFGEVAAKVTQTFIMQCIGGPNGDWEKAVPSSTQMFMRTRLGMKEPVQEHQFSGAVGTYDLSKLTDAELEQIVESQNILSRVAARIGPPRGNGSA